MSSNQNIVATKSETDERLSLINREEFRLNDSASGIQNSKPQYNSHMIQSMANGPTMQDEQQHSAVDNVPADRSLIDTGSNNVNNNAAMADDNSMPTSVEDDQNYQFYKEYCRLYYANIILTNRLQQLLNEKKDLQFKLSRLESNRQAHEEALGMTFDITDERRKRHRRTANEIQRHYVCPIEDCPKSYGSEGSLNQHLKIKHLEYYQAQIQASNAQQHIVSGVISQVNGAKVVGLPSTIQSSVSRSHCKTENGSQPAALTVASGGQFAKISQSQEGDEDSDDDGESSDGSDVAGGQHLLQQRSNAVLPPSRKPADHAE